MRELTPWFPPSIKPVRIGVYQTNDNPNPPWYRHWNGEQWGMGCRSIGEALAARNSFWSQSICWRGLVRQP